MSQELIRGIQTLIEAVNSKLRFEVIDITQLIQLQPGQYINEQPGYQNLDPGDDIVLPDGLISYSIYNYGNSDILVDGIPIKPGMIINEKQELIVGVLKGVTVTAQLSSAFITYKSKA